MGDNAPPEAVIFERLQVELRILSDVARRIEYAVVDNLVQSVAEDHQADIQLLDLLIQSTETLDMVLGRLARAANDQSQNDYAHTIGELPLGDMAARLGGRAANGCKDAAAQRNKIDLF